MSTMNRLHPFTVFLYFVLVIGVTAFTMHPVILCISILGVLVFTIVREEQLSLKKIGGILLAFIVLSLINPLFYHNGSTVLFFINGNAITLEALIYGMVSAGIIVSVLLWCQKLNAYMTTNKTMFLIGKLSKKGALIISMVFRLMPQYHAHAKEIKETQKTMGLFKKESLLEKLMAYLHIFSSMVTWSLEHSVDTADSMRARGYGLNKRTSYASYPFKVTDAICVLAMFLMSGLVLLGVVTGQLGVSYYPVFMVEKSTRFTNLLYISYGVLVLMMPLYEGKENIKWNYLKWKN